MLSASERSVARNRGVLVSEPVVMKSWATLFIKVQRPAGHVSALTHDHAMWSRLRCSRCIDFNVCSDAERTVFDINHRRLWHAHVGRRVGHRCQAVE